MDDAEAGGDGEAGRSSVEGKDVQEYWNIVECQKSD